MTRTMSAVVLVAAAAFTLAGCGADTTSSSSGATVPASITPKHIPDTANTPPPVKDTTAPLDTRATMTTLTGRAHPGTHGCLQLSVAGQDTPYDLVANDTNDTPGIVLALGRLTEGASVTVDGYADPTVSAPCGSGVPFVVTAVDDTETGDAT